MRNYKLPSFVFLKKSLQEEEIPPREKRVVVMHIPSATIVEVVHADKELFNLDLDYDFMNKHKQKISFSLHSTLIYKSQSTEMKKIFRAMEEWYLQSLMPG